MSAPTTTNSATTDDLIRTATAVFGDAKAVTVADSVNPAEPVWDIDVRSYETHDRVGYYVGLFTTTARERFVQRLSRGTRYEPMIRAKLRANGMPEDLTYLALIESGYDPHAYSRAAAVGMWQFMSSTARDVGLRVDWWVDERRDPARATDGAIRFLSELQKQFGSFYLAAAAYNGGPGRVAKGLTRFAEELDGVAGEDRFFALAEQDFLRAETRNYVPQLIAAALVAKKPVKYGLAFDSLPLYAYDSVEVAPGTSLNAVAVASGASAAELKELNPAILRGVAPPDASVWVRVPSGRGEGIPAALERLGAEAKGWEMAAVAKSTTLAAFAGRYGVSAQQVRWFNPSLKTTKRGQLVAGQSVRVPRADALGYVRDVPDPSIERWGGGSAASVSARGVHVVRRGETLGTIARRYGLSESRLKSMNGLRGTRVLAGQTLVVRAGRANTSGASSAKSSLKSRVKSGNASTSAKKTSTKSGAPKSTAASSSAKRAAGKASGKAASSRSGAKGSAGAKASAGKSAKSKAGAKRPAAAKKGGKKAAKGTTRK